MAMEEIRTTSTTSVPSGTVRTSETHSIKKNRNGLVGGVIIVLLLLILLVLWGMKAPTDGGKTEGPREIAPGEILTDAPDGEIINGFPRELILEEDITTDESYSIAYADENMSQPVVSFHSKKSLAENITGYRVYLETNGWNITHQADADEAPSTFFYAYKENAETNITFVTDASGITVTISYVLHQQ